MRGQLPRYPEDEIDWICKHLQDIEPQSVSGFLQAMGVPTRAMTGSGPSPEYHRMSAAFRRGQEAGRLSKSVGRKSWRVVAVARAS